MDLRYPIGPFAAPPPPGRLDQAGRQALIAAIAEAPERLRAAVSDLTDAQLDTPYRPGGWTVRQVVHHLPDSHLNAYVRLKLTLTEQEPTVKPYDQAAWAELPDVALPIAPSLALLEGLHARWTHLLRQMGESDFARPFRHPEESGVLTVDWLVALYGWHGRHHVAQITALREREGW